MATKTTYIPISLNVNNNEYDIFKQLSCGNLSHAKLMALTLRKDYIRPNYLVRRRHDIITIYIKKFKTHLT